MIKEAYCSKKVSELLKEKGFNEPIWTRHEDGNEVIFGDKYNWNNSPMGQISATTHQMAIAWLREEKNICIVIEPYSYDYVNEKNLTYSFSLWEGDNYYENPELKGYSSYEETVEAALKFCLEKLI
jgi:hypothetical protein